jgi:pimeloyl-ACP methyl ester carboxylesterase
MSLILLPGLGTDERLFQPQRAAFPDFIVPPWIPPRPAESLAAYAGRLAGTIRPVRPFVLGGVSLGGMMAFELSRHLRPEALVLVASCRSRRGVRAIYQYFRPFLARMTRLGMQGTQMLAPLAGAIFPGEAHENVRLCTTMYHDGDPQFMAWALGAILAWEPEPLDGLRIFQIHGGRDQLLGPAPSEADEIIPDGGHLINLSHPQQVNALIQRALDYAAGLKLGPAS